MDFLESMAFRHPIYLLDGDEKVPLPDWAKAYLWLGWWCRKLQLEHDRLLVVSVLPTRELAAAFAGLGCLLAGAQQPCEGFNWQDFRNLPPGSEVFWKVLNNNTKYGGIVLEPTDGDTDLVPVKITTRINKGTTWSFSPSKFVECLFSQENLPTPRGTVAMENAMLLHQRLGLETKPRWIWTAGAEAQVVTNQTRFREALTGLQIGAQGTAAVPFEDALCAPRDGDKLTKLRVLSVGHAFVKDVPVTMLDGEAAFDQRDQIETGNVLILLERTEYTAEIHNYLLDLRNWAEAPPPEVLQDMPSRFPPGMELTAFVVPKSQ